MTWTGGVSYVTVATPSAKRYFDLDAVRIERPELTSVNGGTFHDHANDDLMGRGQGQKPLGGGAVNPAGAPPLDWHIENPDWLPPDPEQGTDVTARLIIGDTRDVTATIPDGSIDLIVTSPPFLALRSYLPADHPDKWREIGSEPTPAGFLDTLLELTAEWRRVLAPHGSICVELGDTYSGSVGAGGDYNDGGLREGQERFRTKPGRDRHAKSLTPATGATGGFGWPLAKSLCGIPTLYTWSLAYGRNLLTGQPSPAGRWRIRNLIAWARPNPPVGALGDKFRPATSYITVACTSAKRWFDLDAVRTETDRSDLGGLRKGTPRGTDERRAINGETANMTGSNPAGAPPLDWHSDMPDEDGDWLWKLATAPYKGAHYATYPFELPRRLIDAMCPRRVCTTCGKPSERIVQTDRVTDGNYNRPHAIARSETNGRTFASNADTTYTTLGWTDCGHDTWRNGMVLDPFAGSGTTLEAATALGRDSTGIDLDPRNAHLAEQRCGMFLELDNPDPQPVRGWVDVPLPAWEEDAS